MPKNLQQLDICQLNIDLIKAVAQGHKENVTSLLQQGADPNIADNNGFTPLIIAAQKGLLDVVKYLVEKDADVNKAHKDGCTPLYSAAQNGLLDVVKYLVEKDADVNKANNNGFTPLFIAEHNGHLDVVKYLVEKDADVNKANNNGFTPLYVAAQNGHLDAVKYLVKKRADVNKAQEGGCTPLMVAADKGYIKIVELLLAKGADAQHSNINGNTALVIAKTRKCNEVNKQQYKQIIQLLNNRGACVGISNLDAIKRCGAKKAIDNEITEIFRLLDSKLKYSDKISLGDVGITARNDITKLVLKLENEKLLSFIKEIFKSNQQNKLESPFVVEESAIWYDTSKLPIEINKDKQYVVATDLKNYLDYIRNAIEGDGFQRLLDEEKMLKEQQIKQQQEEEEGEKLLNSIKREIASLEGQLKVKENELEKEEEKRDGLISKGREFKCDTTINKLETAISNIEERIKEAEKSLIATLKSQANRITTTDERKEKIQQVEKNEQELLKRDQEKDKQKLDASSQRYKYYQSKCEKEKNDPKKAYQYRKLMDKENGLMKELAKRDSAAYTELLTRLQNEQAASRRSEEHRRLEKRREEDQKEREERKKERDQKAPSKDDEDKENECSQEGPHRYYQVPQQVEKTLSLSDIEPYRLLLFGLDQFNFKTLISTDLQVVASGPLNPLLDHEAKELAFNTQQRVIKSKQAQDDKSPEEKALIIAQEREEQKIFHNLLDQVIKRVSLKSDFTGNDANIRSLIYSFLCHCAGDQDSVARSYKKLEIEGENVGTYTGLGHASGNSVENLKALQNILKQFIPAEDSSEKKLFEDVTYSDLKKALTQYYTARNSQIILDLFRSENLEVPKDAHSYIKDIFRDLFMQDHKENDFTKTLKEKFIDFAYGHVILGNIIHSITKEDILDNLKKQYAGGNFELLDRVIASSLDKENLAREEADALSVHSFDDFKEMMEDSYKNYETKIKQEHIKGQVRKPSTALSQVRGATIAEYSREASEACLR